MILAASRNPDDQARQRLTYFTLLNEPRRRPSIDPMVFRIVPKRNSAHTDAVFETHGVPGRHPASYASLSYHLRQSISTQRQTGSEAQSTAMIKISKLVTEEQAIAYTAP